MHGITQKVGILEFAMLSAGVHSRRAFSKVGGRAFGQSSRGGVRSARERRKSKAISAPHSAVKKCASSQAELETETRRNPLETRACFFL